MATQTPEVETASETIQWADYLIPLPQEFVISGEVRISPDHVGLVTPPGESTMVTEAVSELRATYREKSGRDPAGGSFVIHIGRLSALGSIYDKAPGDAARLRQTPHPDQAYVIRPHGSNALIVSGLDDKGVFYGIQTLRQLLMARITKTEVVVPLATVTDWPDFEERGLWNSGLRTPAHIPWLAGMKLNFEHINHPVHPDPDEPRCPPLPMDVIGWARARAFHIMPHCWHYDFWSDQPDLSEHYPELIGRGESARNPSSVATPGYHPRARCTCASGPILGQLLAEWMQSAAEQGVREVSLWLSEYQPCRCTCDRCVQEGSHQLIREARASIQAILEARERYPDLVGRLFLTFNLKDPQEEEACRTCLALVPTDGSVKVECVYGLQGPFDDYARAGNWVANYGVGASLGGLGRSRGAARLRLYPDPEDLRRRVEHLRSTGYRALYSMSSVSVGGAEKGAIERHLCDFHIAMLAEWCWNAGGRNVREFMRAWVTSRGYASPERAVEWMDGMLPVERAVCSAINALPAMVEAMTHGDALELGKAPGLEGFPAEEAFEEQIRAVKRCGSIAEDMGARDMAAESRFLASALGMLRGILRLSRALANPDQTEAGEVAGASQEVSGKIDAMIVAAEDQTAAWTAMPPSTAVELNKYTADYWRNWEHTFRSLGEAAKK